jgi:hypothetical protein
MRYAVRLWLAAPQIMRELEPDDTTATLSRHLFQFVFAPNYVVVYSITGPPLTSTAMTYAVRHPSWICTLVVGYFVGMSCMFALFGRRRLIQVSGGHLPGREAWCRCRFSMTCRSLAFPSYIVGTIVSTMLAFKVTTLSTFPPTDFLLAFGCWLGPVWLQRTGFVT